MKSRRGDHPDALDLVLKKLNDDATFDGHISSGELAQFDSNMTHFDLAWSPVRSELRALSLEFDFETLQGIDNKALQVASVQKCLADSALSTDHIGVAREILGTLGRGARSLSLQRTFLDILVRGTFEADLTERRKRECGMAAAGNFVRRKLYPEVALEVVELVTSVPFWSVCGLLARALARCDNVSLSLEQIEALAQHTDSGLAVVDYIRKRRRLDGVRVLEGIVDSPDKYISRDAVKVLGELRL